MSTTIKLEFDKAMKSLGFIKKSGSWYCRRDSGWLVANLQKSQFADAYYVNLAVWLDAIGGASDFPEENHCHIRFRLERSNGVSKEWCELNNDGSSPSDLVRDLECSLTGRGISLLNRLLTISSIRQALDDGDLSHAFVHKEVRILANDANDQ